ncbi:MAG: glycine--tRNA ligase [Candidatus Diapherotrites archaeon]|uniref:glycine--tRNA ligase n=1 Tax=Candidatus Iainarchaeum sp. TaxID=3101447 RepID=A0A8T4LAK7_9ARCH|nr:glycine--tRNA ligase [Candidatus Diapherotrites archaeon]
MKPTKNDFSLELAAYLSEKDFVYGPEPELYGGIAGFYTYGPLGKRLKNNIETVIRKAFNVNGFFEIEYPLIAPAAVWKASGHLANFSDPTIECSKCNSSFRADKLVEEATGTSDAGHLTDEQLVNQIREHDLKCLNCKGRFNLEIKRYSLMLKTTIGSDIEAYNRPETATTTYLPFKHYLNFFRNRLPFTVFQIGKAFRNEISPRQHLLRMREFTQAESQFFIAPESKHTWEKFSKIENETLPFWTEDAQKKGQPLQIIKLKDALAKKILKNKAYAWNLWLSYHIFTEMGIPVQKIRLRQHYSDERAFYSDDTWDLEVELNAFGWTELAGISDRTDYDLKQHAKHSNQKLVARSPENVEFVPHVIEIAFGVDRPVFALCDLFYSKREQDEKRTILAFPPKMAPIQVAVFPLVKKDGLDDKAEQLYRSLENQFLCYFDDSGSIGKRYSRMDAVGTPYCITIDYDSMQHQDVTVRERDSMKQERVKLSELEKYLFQRLQK